MNKLWLYNIICLFIIIIRIFCFIIGVYVLFFIEVYMVEFILFSVYGVDFRVLLLFDWIRLFFGGVVFLISFCVVIYREWYIVRDFDRNKFILLLLIFILSIIVVIFSPSLIRILLGWDGLGIVSYCLVIYYHNYRSYSAGIITGVINRLGDVFLLLTVGLLFRYGSWNFYIYEKETHVVFSFIYFFVLIAGFTKSAQIPFSAWLPAAMAAPTPVSALVHSSTLVTAGVYLLIRFYYFIDDRWILIIGFIYCGLLTSFIAGLSANFEVDLKKIIALSTLRQLGIIIVRVRLGNLEIAYFHLVIHAVFKALLFLCGGKIIHLMGGYQDIRFMGGISLRIVLSITCLNIANFSLCGIPFMSGFYSKDLIFESLGVLNINLITIFLFFFCGVFSCTYRLKFWWVRRFVYYGGSDYLWEDNIYKSLFPEMILAFFGIISGSLIFWLGLPEVEEILVFGVDKIWPLIIVLIGVVSGIIFIYFILDFWWAEVWYLIIFIFDLSSLMAWVPFFSVKYIWTYDYGWGELIGAFGVSKIMGGVPMVFSGYQNIEFLVIFLILIIRVILVFFLFY